MALNSLRAERRGPTRSASGPRALSATRSSAQILLELAIFEDDAARSAFIERSFSAIEVRQVSDAPRAPALPFDDVIGNELAAVTFVRDYLQLSFDSPPLTLWVWPRIHREETVLRRGDAGYAESLIALIGRRLVAADELLDLGLTLDFEERTRLTIPLDGTDCNGPEVAMFDGHPGGFWQPGSPPFACDS